VSKDKTPIKRIEFLAKKFQVFDKEDLNEMSIDCLNGNYVGVYNVGEGDVHPIVALHTWNQRKYKNTGEYIVDKVSVFEDVFINMVQSDPTEHKEYVQWMLTTFVRFIKQGNQVGAIRFVNEDLWLASEYLEIFHSEKHKPKFKALCSGNKAFKDIEDPSNINQYRDLSQLFDAIDPYVIRSTSKLEKDIRVASKLGDGRIEYEDRKVIIFIPKTIKSSRLFASFTRWCTTTNKSTFNHYVNNLTSKGTKSKLYVIIPKTFLLTDDDNKKTSELYQLHFETKQFMDRSDRMISNMSALLRYNVGLRDYFYDELIGFARANHKNYQNNKYVDGLKSFGFANIIFEVLPPNINKIMLNGEELSDTSSIGKFDKLEILFINNCKIGNLHPSIGELKLLGSLSLPGNNLKSLPSSIGRLKNLRIINISGNFIERIPESIRFLDKDNGGSLDYFSYSKNQLSDELVNNLREWLPNAIINEFEGET
jgi:hypothetical protein